MHRTWVEIDERALINNITALRGLLSPDARFCATVKANAYGHGLREISRIAARGGVDAFGVDSLDDALWLRQEFPSALVLVLGYVVRDRLDEVVAGGIHLVVSESETIRALELCAAARATTAYAHLKIDTGTARQGILPEQLSDFLSDFSSSPHVSLAGLATHFANIEDTTDTRFANLQFARFQEVRAAVQAAGYNPEWIHCACSAAAILYPDTHGTLVRIGISLYGLWSSDLVEVTTRKHGVPCALEPVLTWKSRIIQIKSLPAGTPIGYGLTEILKRASRIAVVPVGYWDGYDRGLSSVAEVLVGGHRCKVMGRICMNMMMIDVSAVPTISLEQEVVLLGRSGRHQVTAEQMAAWTGTINYEIVTRINPTLPRLVV